MFLTDLACRLPHLHQLPIVENIGEKFKPPKEFSGKSTRNEEINTAVV